MTFCQTFTNKVIKTIPYITEELWKNNKVMDVIICKWLRVRENRLSLMIYFLDYNDSWILLYLNPCAWLSLKRNIYLNKPAAESYRFVFKCVCRRNQEEETRNWGVNVNYQTQGNNRLDNVPYTGFSVNQLSPCLLSLLK